MRAKFKFWCFVQLAILFILGLIISFRGGFKVPYHWVSDFDCVPLMQGLYFNSHITQTYWDHTAYTLFILVGLWYRLMHFLGFIGISTFGDLVKSATPFKDLVSLVYVNRVLTFIFANLFCLTVAGISYRLTRNKWLALVAGCLIAATQGLAAHLIQTRTEMLASLAVVLYFFWSLCWLRANVIFKLILFAFLSGFFAIFAPMTKIQVIPSIVILSAALVIIAFFDFKNRPKFDFCSRVSWPVLVILLIGTAFFSHGFFSDMWDVLIQTNGNFFNALISKSMLIVFYAFILFLLAGKYWIRSWKSTILSATFFVNGCATAYSLIFLQPYWRNVQALFAFDNYAKTFYAGGAEYSLPRLAWYTFINKFSLTDIIWQVDIQIFWLSVLLVGLVSISGKKNRAYFLLSACFIIAASTIETISSLRYLSSVYKVFFEYLLVTSIAISLGALWENKTWYKSKKLLTSLAVVGACCTWFLISNIHLTRKNELPAINVFLDTERFCFFLGIAHQPATNFFESKGGCQKMLEGP